MKIRTRVAVMALAAAALSPVGLAPASAAGACDNDTTAPAVGAITITPGDVVVGKIRQSVTASLSATDDCGVSSSGMYLTYSRVGDVSAGSLFFSDFRLVSGSGTNGTWQSTEVISDYQSGGPYEASEVRLHDDAYNVTDATYPAATRLQVRGATSFDLDAPSPARLVAGAAAAITGQVLLPQKEATGRLELQSLSPSGTWARVASIARAAATTYSSFSITVRPTATTRYRVAYLGDAVSAAATSPVLTVSVAPSITARASATRVAARRPLAISGVVRPVLAGQTVTVQRLVGSRWVNLGAARLTRTGTYKAVVRLPARGTALLRVIKAPDRDRLAGVSAPVRVTVA